MRVLLLSVLFAGLLAGCALSPQQVDLNPRLVSPPQDNRGHNRPVVVIGKDERDSQVVGSRGGIYANTSLIRTSDDVGKTLAKLVRNSLQSRGFNSFNAPAGAPQLEVALKALHYQPASGYIINRVVVNARLEARLTSPQGGVFKRTYSSHITFKQPVAPSAAKNQQMLNKVLARCVDQLLTDPLLLQQLVGSEGPEAAGQSQKAATNPANNADANLDTDNGNDVSSQVMPGTAPSVAPPPVNQ